MKHAAGAINDHHSGLNHIHARIQDDTQLTEQTDVCEQETKQATAC